jgi:predicted AlkP superfamily pyrophosphatase or phosphodiesterase
MKIFSDFERMKRWMPVLAFLVVSFRLAAQNDATPYVILISFDGFRHDYVKNFAPPHISEFIKIGTQAEGLVPSFPSKTFPNHYTIVTGLTPGHHGLVDNTFFDPKRRVMYGMRDEAVVVDPYYYGGIPLWELAKQNGVRSASYFWVGSEMTEEKRHPDYYVPFDDKEDPQKRIDQTLAWLRLPEKERPHLITLYFSSPDHEGHDFGPNSIQAKNAVLRDDSLLNNLMTGLKSIPLPVNVILVSDHGMAELTVQQETYIFMDDLLNRKDTSVVIAIGGTQAHLYIKSKQKQDSIYKRLKQKQDGFYVLKKSEYPERWDYRVDRAGDMMIIANQGKYIRGANWDTFLKTAAVGSKFGVHGYDPVDMKDMRGIFYAQGPNIKSGLTIPAFQNIHIYPLVAKILGLPLPPIDGKPEVLESIYQSGKK